MSRWRAPLLLPVPSLEADDDEEDVVERAKENRACGPDPGIGDVGALILMAVSWDATELERVVVFGSCSCSCACACAGVSDCETSFNLARLNFPDRVDGLRAVRPPDGRSNGRC